VSAQPLLVLGERRRRQLLARLCDNARRWRQAWSPGSTEKFEAQCEATARTGYSVPVAAVSTSCWSLEVAGERDAVLLLPHVTFAWCVVEAGGLAPETGSTITGESLAEKLECEVATSLFAELGTHEPREVLQVSRMPGTAIEAWSREVRAWKTELRATDSGRMFTLLLSARRIEALAPARAMPRGALDSRRHAVGENRVRLRALAGETTMSVSELAGLAVDDVLVLDQRLAEPVTLLAGQAQVSVASGNLGRAGANRAVKLVGIAAQKN